MFQKKLEKCYILVMDIKEKIDGLTEKLINYQKAYYVDGRPLASDLEYDRLFDELARLEKANPSLVRPDSPTLRVGSDLSNDFPEIEHTIPVLSLDKAYSRDEVLSFIDKCIRKESSSLTFVAEEKIDGISMVLYYEEGILSRAVTRGNGLVGNDVTANIRTIKSIPLSLPEKIDLAVRGEVFLRKKDFEIINSREEDEDKKAANPRNLAAGTVRRQKSEEAARVPLDMFIYEGFWRDRGQTPKDHLHILRKLKDLGFKINSHMSFFAHDRKDAEAALAEAGLEGKAYAFAEMEDYIAFKTNERKNLEWEIDGLVFKINELETRERFGYTEHHPRWAVAYKFESPQAVSRLLGITVQVGRTGRITPVAELMPVSLGGSVIRRATLHNQEYIDSLELAVGDTVSIVKRGDVIPAVEDVIEKNGEGNTTYEIPLSCPSCGSPLEKDGAHMYCPNRGCPEQVKGLLSFFASRNQMDIETLGPKTIELFYEKGVLRRIEDIYGADYSSLVGMPGIGEKTIRQIVKSVEESKSRPFKVVLSSLGISEIGKKSAEILVSGGFDSIDKLKAADEDDLVRIPGIGERTAHIIVEAFADADLLRTLDSLASHGLHMSQADDGEEEVLEQTLQGTVWCVTGSFENFNPRSKALEEIERRGGRTVSSVTGKTTHLLAGSGGGSKRADAERLGVRIVDEREFLVLIGKAEEEKGGQLELF